MATFSMWKKPENPTACGGGEWLPDVCRSTSSERASSLALWVLWEGIGRMEHVLLYSTETQSARSMCYPCDLLIMDEIGSLALERDQGWPNALDVGLALGSCAKFRVVPL